MVLIGYWPLNEDSSSTKAKDHSGNENHGIINDGGDSTIPGTKGILGQNTYNFDGTNDKVNISNLSWPTGSYSLSLWVFPTSYANSLTWKGILYMPPNKYNRIALIFKSDAIHWLNNNEGSDGGSDGWDTEVKSSGEAPQLDSWSHIMITYSSGNSAKLYLNGKKVAEDRNAQDVVSTEDTFTIGYRDYTDTEHFEGKISETRIYNREMTPLEIQYLYNVSKKGSQVTSKKHS